MIPQNPIAGAAPGPATQVKPAALLPAPVKDQTSEPREQFIPSSTPQTLREPSGEMAEMLDNIQRAQERDQAYNSANLTGLQAKAAPSSNSQVPTTLVMLDEPPAEDHSQEAHGHHHPHHAFLGGHLTLEGGEQILQGLGHHASHALGDVATAHAHAASEASSNALGEAADATVTAEGTHLTGYMAALGGAGAALSGALGVCMLYVGGKEIKEGLKKKDAEHTLEGVGSTIVGVRSGLAGAGLAATLTSGSEVAQVVAHSAHYLLPPLGIAHGAIDVGLGVKDIVVGVHKGDRSQITRGALGVGLGGALAVAALGGGLPALGVAAVFLGGKIVQQVREKHHAQEKASIPS